MRRSKRLNVLLGDAEPLITEIAEEDGLTMAEIVRRALREYYRRWSTGNQWEGTGRLRGYRIRTLPDGQAAMVAPDESIINIGGGDW